MGKKLTKEEFVRRAKEIHGDKYDYIKTIYVNRDNKVIIICKKHGEFYKIPREHLGGSGCVKCSSECGKFHPKKTFGEFVKMANDVYGDCYSYDEATYYNLTEKTKVICAIHGPFFQTPIVHLRGSGCSLCKKNNRFIEKAQKIHGDTYLYDNVNYVGTRIKVKIICRAHGEFEQIPESHLAGAGCDLCGRERGNKKKALNTEEFIKRAKIIHGDKYDYSMLNYVNICNNVDIICLKHGSFSQRAGIHLNGHGCLMCGYDKNADRKYDTNIFISKARNRHGDKYDYSESNYISSHDPIYIICRKHGGFFQTPSSHLFGAGCPKCNHIISKPCTEWLDKLGIENREITIKATSGNRYRVDGYDPKTKTVYEYFGVFWHGSPDYYDPNDINPINKKTYGELYKKTQERISNLEADGYNVVYKWEEPNTKKTK